MSEAHQDAIYYLIYFVALLILAIATPFLLKAFKKKTPPSVLQPESPSELQSEMQAKSLQDSKFQQDSSTIHSEPRKLQKTEQQIFGRLKSLFSSNQKTPALDEIEEILYTSDLGPATVEKIMSVVSNELSKSEKNNFFEIQKVIQSEMQSIFDSLPATPLVKWAHEGPTVIMIVGVNGAGKTTTIGKLSSLWALEGKKVLVAAGDTFRAAAGSQLKVWTDRAQVEIFSPPNVSDPSAVAFDAIQKAKARGDDLVLLDTAGRLPNQAHLMDELKKVKRVMTKVIPDAPHEVWIVLDANSGQNALAQAKQFHEALGLSGVVLTKLDGTSKGGVAVSVVHDLRVPIKWIGVGEKIQDLKIFSSQDFIQSIASRETDLA